MAEIEKLSESENRIFYSTTCQCMSRDHALMIELEFDKEFNMVTMEFYVDCGCYYDYYDGEFDDVNMFVKAWRWSLNMVKRFRVACRVFFTGHIKLEHSFIFRSAEQISALKEELDNGARKLIENRSKNV